MSYVTVFDAAQNNGRAFALIALALIPFGIGILLVLLRRFFSLLPQSISLALGLLLMCFGIIDAWTAYRDNTRQIDPRVTEGPITYFKPMPAVGHAMETFCVRTQCFSYSDYILTRGFNKTSSHGGPIALGRRVRVTYVGNTILKLEIAR
jgi:hypothetical protein